MNFQDIVDLIPFQSPFRFVDEITFVDESRIEGNYTFREDEFFYQGHFPFQPITPGVILTETLAQIGMVAFGIYLLQQKNIMVVINKDKMPLLTSSNINFYKKVFPGETVYVTSVKTIFRFGKLRCNVSMKDDKDNLICEGVISGVFL